MTNDVVRKKGELIAQFTSLNFRLSIFDNVNKRNVAYKGYALEKSWEDRNERGKYYKAQISGIESELYNILDVLEQHFKKKKKGD